MDNRFHCSYEYGKIREFLISILNSKLWLADCSEMVITYMVYQIIIYLKRERKIAYNILFRIHLYYNVA